MSFLPRLLLPKTIGWQIIAFVALCLMLGNAITFVIVSYEFRTEPRLQSPESAVAEITTFARLLGAAETQSEFSKLLAQGDAIGIAVQEATEVQLQAQSSERDKTTALAERRAAERGLTVLSGYSLPEGGPNSLVLRLPNHRVVSFVLPASRARPPLFGGPALLTASIAAAFILVLCTYVLWSITSPLASFAGAAEAFGRSLKDGPPLREKGPNEIAKLAPVRLIEFTGGEVHDVNPFGTEFARAVAHSRRLGTRKSFHPFSQHGLLQSISYFFPLRPASQARVLRSAELQLCAALVLGSRRAGALRSVQSHRPIFARLPALRPVAPL